MEKERNENGPFKSMEDFIDRMSDYSMNRKMVECLILSGAFDSFGKTRSSCMAIYEKLMQRASKDKKTRQLGQISFFGTNDIEDKVEYPDIKEFNKKTLLKNEREIIGVYMSGHPLEDHVDKFKNFSLTAEMYRTMVSVEDEEMQDDSEEDKFAEEMQLLDGQPFSCGGIIVEANRKRTKSGKDMCYVKLEDLTGTLEIVFFPNIYQKFRSILEEDNMVTIKGKINVRDGNAPSLVADAAYLWNDEEKQAKEMSKGRVFLRFDTKDIDVYSKVKSTLMSYPGESQVTIRCTSTGSAFNFQSKVSINNYLVNELSGIIGNENIIVQEQK